uniref:Peroxisome proliferator-activated receptor alpha n=1 Tax=Myotis lucifugus TaxID=59463 RepID=G1PWZ6_MYOLU
RMVDTESPICSLFPLEADDLESPLSEEFLQEMGSIQDMSQSLGEDSSGSFSFTDYQYLGSGPGSEGSVITDTLSPASSPSSVSYPVVPGSAEEASSTALNIECRICGDKASGYHYGVHACEGCKLFYTQCLSLRKQHDRKKDTCRHLRLPGQCVPLQFHAHFLGTNIDVIREGKLNLCKLSRPNYIAFQNYVSEFSSSQKRSLARRIYEAYLRNFNMNKAKARGFLAGKAANNPPGWQEELETGLRWWENIYPEARGPGQGDASVRPSSCCPAPSVTRRLRCRALLRAALREGAARLADEDVGLSLGPGARVPWVLMSRLKPPPWESQAGSCSHRRQLVSAARGRGTDALIPSRRLRSLTSSLSLGFSELKVWLAVVMSCSGTDRPGLLHVGQIEKMQEGIVHVLRLHLQGNHPDAAFLFPKLLQKMADLRQLVTEHAQLVQVIKRTEADAALHPLLQEIYRDMY